MTESVIERNTEPWTLDPSKEPQWEYTYGLVLKAILDVWSVTGESRYFDYVKAYYDHFIDAEGRILTYRLDEYNIDRINPGKALFRLYREAGDERYRRAIALLRSQMETHPRTSEGGFWHKRIYPHQMWLDGLYMAAPFLAEVALMSGESEIFDDVASQFVLMESHAREESSGLLVHGWDESRQQRWADPETGRSSQFWGRAMGWYAMALVDVLDFFPESHPRRRDVIDILKRLAVAVSQVQDKDTGLWFQVLDQGMKQGNYLESSASCMFVYALAKGVRKSYLHPAYLHIARRGYGGIIERLIDVDGRGGVHILQACAVAGLGGDPYRDGSYDYYIHAPVMDDDPKAIGPFILASLEMEAAAVSTKSPME